MVDSEKNLTPVEHQTNLVKTTCTTGNKKINKMTSLLCFTGERRLVHGACVLVSLLRFLWRSLRALVGS